MENKAKTPEIILGISAILNAVSVFLPFFRVGSHTYSLWNFVNEGVTDGSAEGVFYGIIALIYIILAVLAAIFALCKKPVPTLVFTCILALLFVIMLESFTRARYSVAMYTSLITIIADFVLCIVVLVLRKKSLQEDTELMRK